MDSKDMIQQSNTRIKQFYPWKWTTVYYIVTTGYLTGINSMIEGGDPLNTVILICIIWYYITQCLPGFAHCDPKNSTT